MKRATLEATDENILNSIKENTYGRNAAVEEFISALDTIEGNMFISLDAQWGEGKTFYVRQIEKTLEYLTKKQWGDEKTDTESIKWLESYFQKTTLNKIELKNSYLPIYYNAWLYDSHDDPLMSLMMILGKKSEQYLKMKMGKSFLERMGSLLSSVSFSVNYNKEVSFGFEGSGIAEALKSSEEIWESIKTAEQKRELVKGILNDIVTERAQRLVIFIDELDRCRPTYAIEMLERIKHYFDDERIIFVVSVNKSQLVHTISKYYGYGFDSTGYLNKFFDHNIHMPVIKKAPLSQYNSHMLLELADGLSDYYKLSLRDKLIFEKKVTSIPSGYFDDSRFQSWCLLLFVPIIMILDLKDENEKTRFINGDSSILEKLSNEIYIVKDIIMVSAGYRSDEEYQTRFERFQKSYEYAFNGKDPGDDSIRSGIRSNFKSLCIRLSNSVE